MKIGIIGAGIAGLTTAIALQNIGLSPIIYEAAPEIKPLGAGLALAANALKAFRKLGIADAVMAAGHCLSEFTILDERGKIITSTDSREASHLYGLDNFTIHRANLHQVLFQHIDQTTLFTNKKATGIRQSTDEVSISFQDGSVATIDHLIVADGIHSPIRQQLVPHVPIRYAGYTCWRAVIENPGLHLTAATETWGAKGRVGVVPLTENKIYWFACALAPFNSARHHAFTISDLRHRFQHYHQPIPQLLAHTANEQLLVHDILDLPQLPHYAYGNVLFIGDAAHATTPNMGQGACQAIEDGVILAEELKKNPDFAEASVNFEKRRQARTQWIIRDSYRIGKMAQLENRILVNSRNFILRSLPKFLNKLQVKRLYKVDF